MMHTCEKCGSREVESRWLGLTYELRCAKCRWGAVTTMIPPIMADKGPYRIVIVSLGTDPNRSLIVLNRRFTHGIQRTRTLFSQGERELLSERASVVWREAQLLRAEHVPFRIDPVFPYDLETYDAEHGHEHDWLPYAPSA